MALAGPGGAVGGAWVGLGAWQGCHSDQAAFTCWPLTTRLWMEPRVLSQKAQGLMLLHFQTV